MDGLHRFGPGVAGFGKHDEVGLAAFYQGQQTVRFFIVLQHIGDHQAERMLRGGGASLFHLQVGNGQERVDLVAQIGQISQENREKDPLIPVLKISQERISQQDKKGKKPLLQSGILKYPEHPVIIPNERNQGSYNKYTTKGIEQSGNEHGLCRKELGKSQS